MHTHAYIDTNYHQFNSIRAIQSAELQQTMIKSWSVQTNTKAAVIIKPKNKKGKLQKNLSKKEDE